MEPGAQAALSGAASRGRAPFGALCVAGEAAVTVRGRRMSQPPRLPAPLGFSLPAQPLPALGIPLESPAGMNLRLCRSPSLPCCLGAVGPALWHSGTSHGTPPLSAEPGIASLPQFQGFRAPRLAWDGLGLDGRRDTGGKLATIQTTGEPWSLSSSPGPRRVFSPPLKVRKSRSPPPPLALFLDFRFRS